MSFRKGRHSQAPLPEGGASAENPLVQKAKETVPALVEAARILGEEFVRELGSAFQFDPERSEVDLLVEILLFVLHLLDRLLWVTLGPFKRKVFVDAVLEELSRAVKPMGLTVDTFRDRYNKSQRRYAKCEKLLPEDGETFRGTLFWEFGKRLTLRYRVSNPVAAFWFSSRGVDVMESLNEVLTHLELEKVR